MKIKKILTAAIFAVSYAYAFTSVKTCYKYDVANDSYETFERRTMNFTDEDALREDAIKSLSGLPKNYLATLRRLRRDYSLSSPDYLGTTPYDSIRECDRVEYEMEMEGEGSSPEKIGNTFNSRTVGGMKRSNGKSSVVVSDALYGTGEIVGFSSGNFGIFAMWRIGKGERERDGKRVKVYYAENVNWMPWITRKLWAGCLSGGKPPLILSNAEAFLNASVSPERAKSVGLLDVRVDETGDVDESACEDRRYLEERIAQVTNVPPGGEKWSNLEDDLFSSKMFRNGGWVLYYPYKDPDGVHRIFASWAAQYMKENGITSGTIIADDVMKIKARSWKKRKKFGRKKTYVEVKIDVDTYKIRVMPISMAFPFEEPTVNYDWKSASLAPVALIDPIPSGEGGSVVNVTPLGNKADMIAYKDLSESGGEYHFKKVRSKSSWSLWIVILVVLTVVVVSMFAFGGFVLPSGVNMGSFFYGVSNGYFIFTVGSVGAMMSFAGIAASAIAGTLVASFVFGSGSSVSELESRLKESYAKVIKTSFEKGNFDISKILTAPYINPPKINVVPVGTFSEIVSKYLSDPTKTREGEWNVTTGSVAGMFLESYAKVGPFTFWDENKYREMEMRALHGAWLVEYPPDERHYFDGKKVIEEVMKRRWR